MHLILIRLFPLWAITLSLLAFFIPIPFLIFKEFIPELLGLIMLGMGMSLNLSHLKSTCRYPSILFGGIVAQFTIMPLGAWLLGILFSLPQELRIGLILVGCCPGGTASNVICYLAKADVALSVTLTSLSTLLAIVLTPALTLLLAGQLIEVPAGKMLLDILQIIILPIMAGMLINFYFKEKALYIRTYFPLVSVGAIVLIIAVIIALNQQTLHQTVPGFLLVAIILHNALGLAGGYVFGVSRGYPQAISRTLAIEVGMQNSGLGVALAIQYFGITAALPGAIFSIWHNISGSILAAYWSGKQPPYDSPST